MLELLLLYMEYFLVYLYLGDKMGLGKQLKELSKEYMKNPKKQYFRHLEKILNLHKQSHVSKEEVIDYVNKWKE